MLFRTFIFLMIPIILFSQEKENVIAKVGNYNIFESEFKERFDFSVHPYLQNKSDRNLSKHEFLEQLIAEKLLSLEAQQKGYDTIGIYRGIITPLENMYLRDALYSKEVKAKAAYAQQDISEGISRIRKQLKVRFIYSKDEGELNKIFEELKNGASFDSLLALRGESKDQTEPRSVTFGTMEKEIEDSIYNLAPGEYTHPLRSKDGLYILKLLSVENSAEHTDAEDLRESVRRIVETRAYYKQYLNFYRNFFSVKNASADKEIFERIIKIFITRLNEKYLLHNSSSKGFYLIGGEICEVFQMLSPRLKSMDFIKMSPEPVKIKYFLNQLSHEGLYVKDLNEKSIRAALSSYIRKFIEDELLTREAGKRGLADLPEVKKYIRMWRDSYLSKMLMVDIFDSLKVTDEEAYNIFKRSGGKPVPVEKVKIAEILTDNLAEVELMLKELANGRNIKELAKQYTKRDSLRTKGGEFDYFPVTKYGEIGIAASRINIGEVYGPVKTDEGYSIFQLLDRREERPDHPQDFKEVKEQIIIKVTYSRFENYINRYTATLAQKYGVDINEAALKEIKNVFLNLVVVRYMGFGGEIYAVPFTEQFSGWYKIWSESREESL